MEKFKDLYCNESLLDDLDTLMDKTDKSTKKVFYSDIVKKYPKNDPGCDAYGRKLEVGDWVIYISVGMGKAKLRQELGVVMKITPKRITIGNDLGTASINPNNIFKIIDQNAFIESLG